MSAALAQTIESFWQERQQFGPNQAPAELSQAVESCLHGLEQGDFRVAEPKPGRGEDDASQWQVNEWLKKAVLLFFKITPNQVVQGSPANYLDKVPLQFSTEEQAAAARCRLVPGCLVRRGAFLGRDVVAMPSYVNIGAYVGASTMIDTWATVGSCAQIGDRVHLSGGAGIGGVLEPLQATPTIIEDDCFIGARAEVVEGVIVERGSVLSMGVHIGQSTKIYERATGKIYRGRVPAGSVVVPGSLPAADGSHSLYCAVIVKRVDAATRARTSINELLRADE
ncbi:MAG: 2,3,4,5-tetrahydropyridine-2,6-dicarboxylate N-succinyltransferase [Xanthomonadales bacterium]|nr:2,3,4,5-tetrahydropyridine-2,6-dicarboxylate N-succinyltransferase [Xanthomonadales bacterium]